MKKYFLLALLFLYACSSVDPVEIAKTDSHVSAFLNNYPDADVRFLKVPAADISVKECGEVSEGEYYKIVIESEKEHLFAYTSETEVICVYKVVLDVEEEEEELIEEEPNLEYDYLLKHVILTAELDKGSNEKEINLQVNNTDNLESIEVSFVPGCQIWKVKPLEVSLHRSIIYDTIKNQN